MTIILKQIKSLFPRGEVKESSHFKNIKNGKTLTIDGKKYVKVKLQFIDTFDYNISTTIDNLETETKLLHKKIEILTEKISSANKQISLLRTLNTNLINEEKTESSRLKSEIAKLKTPNKHLAQTIKDLERKVDNQAKHISELEKINKELKHKLKEKSYEYEKLEHRFHNLPLPNQKENSRKMRKRLNDKIEKLTREIKSLKDKLIQQEKLNENLLNQFITEKQRYKKN